MKSALFLATALLTWQATAQQTAMPKTSPIQDNSFLVEEAYNQEAGVVQHISTFTRLWASKSWAYTFTQEWPVPGHERHQLSYTAVVTDSGAGTGVGDTYLHYRYQLVGNGETRVAIAPRMSLVAPSGSARFGRGVGGTGMQMNLPVSIVLNSRFVTHSNVGMTLVPHARNASGDRAGTTSFNAGQSLIWLARGRFNAMLEAVWSRNDSVVGRGRTASSNTVLLNPGIRWAYRFRSGLEIVPGVSVPIGLGPSTGERGLFLYLSFEHSMWKETR